MSDGPLYAVTLTPARVTLPASGYRPTCRAADGAEWGVLLTFVGSWEGRSAFAQLTCAPGAPELPGGVDLYEGPVLVARAVRVSPCAAGEGGAK